jgi:predicted nucleotidyltransferase
MTGGESCCGLLETGRHGRDFGHVVDCRPRDIVMNIHQLDRQKLRQRLHEIEEKYPLRFVGLLGRGSAPHVFGDNALDFLAEKREGLSLLSLTGAEVDLGDILGHPVGIVLRSELHGDDAKRVLATLQPL